MRRRHRHPRFVIHQLVVRARDRTPVRRRFRLVVRVRKRDVIPNRRSVACRLAQGKQLLKTVDWQDALIEVVRIQVGHVVHGDVESGQTLDRLAGDRRAETVSDEMQRGVRRADGGRDQTQSDQDAEQRVARRLGPASRQLVGLRCPVKGHHHLGRSACKDALAGVKPARSALAEHVIVQQPGVGGVSHCGFPAAAQRGVRPVAHRLRQTQQRIAAAVGDLKPVRHHGNPGDLSRGDVRGKPLLHPGQIDAHQFPAADQQGIILLERRPAVADMNGIGAGPRCVDQHLFHIIQMILRRRVQRVLDGTHGSLAGVLRVQRPRVVRAPRPRDPQIQVVDQDGRRNIQPGGLRGAGRIGPNDRGLERLSGGGDELPCGLLAAVGSLG